MAREVQESKRLLYVTLTRPRDGLIITMDAKKAGGEWMDTLEADWMLPEGGSLKLPDGTIIPTLNLELERELEADQAEQKIPQYQPQWLSTGTPESETLPLRLSPSSIAPNPTASIGDIIELGERLPIEGEYDPATLGSALHAVIATTLTGQTSTARILQDQGMENTIDLEAADLSTSRLLEAVNTHFKPLSSHPEYPIHYSNDSGQIVSGWIDLLIETEEGFVLIDHKASPRARSDWEQIALGYSGQLEAYSEGIIRATGRPVLSQWIHFGVTGGLVEIRLKGADNQ